MKKYNLLKILGIFLLGLVVLTWLIPISTFESGVYTKGVVTGLGLFNIFKLPFQVFTGIFTTAYGAAGSYIIYGIYMLVLGGLYGVMKKTGTYDSLVKLFTEKFKDKETLFIMLTTILFTLLTALSGSVYVIFILVPLVINVLLEMGFKKITAITATVGAIIVGTFGSLYGFDISGFINVYFKLDAHQFIVIKIILFLLALALLLLLVLKDVNGKSYKETILSSFQKKKTVKKSNVKAAKKSIAVVTEKKTNKKKSHLPMLLLLVGTVILLLVATYNWRYGISVDLFEKLFDSIAAFKIGGNTIIKTITGMSKPFGWWGIEEVVVIMFALSAIISWLYSLKINDAIEAFIDGAKEMVVPAFYIILANIVMYYMLSGNAGGNMYIAISNYLFTLNKGFNIFFTSLAALFGGVLYNDLPQLIGPTANVVTTAVTNTKVYPVIGLIYQTFHAMLMLLLPTSLVLIAGLTYMKVSYMEWIKHIWKLVLQLFVLSIIIILIMSMLV